MSEKKVEIKIELDQEKKLAINIISKAFNLGLEEFINLVLKKEIHFINCLLGRSYPKENLEDYYKFEIDIDELKKLILVEEIL